MRVFNNRGVKTQQTSQIQARGMRDRESVRADERAPPSRLTGLEALLRP